MITSVPILKKFSRTMKKLFGECSELLPQPLPIFHLLRVQGFETELFLHLPPVTLTLCGHFVG